MALMRTPRRHTAAAAFVLRLPDTPNLFSQPGISIASPGTTGKSAFPATTTVPESFPGGQNIPQLRGRRISTSSPFGTRFRTLMEPPCRWMALCAIARPRPAPS